MVIEALSCGTLKLKLKFKWTSLTHFCVNKTTRQLDNQLECNGLLVFYESQSCCIVYPIHHVFVLCRDISCGTQTTTETLTGCSSTTTSLVLCGGSASIPRGVVTPVYSLGGNVLDQDCRGGQLVDNVGPSPVCASNSPDTPYM